MCRKRPKLQRCPWRPIRRSMSSRRPPSTAAKTSPCRDGAALPSPQRPKRSRRDSSSITLPRISGTWKKTAAQRPVVDSDPVDPADPFDPDAPPAELDELFGVDPDAAFDADPDPLPEELDDAFGVDPGGDTDAPLPS